MQLNQEELYEALGLLIQKIEACGASVQLTDAVILASDISAAVGNKWNRPQAERAAMVRAKLKPKALEPHQQRVVAERSELDEKRSKLTAFIGGEIYRKLDPVEQSRLNRQLESMTLYSNVLGERIAAF